MKKKLNVEGVTNELRGGSAFFPSYDKDSSLPLDEPPQAAHTISGEASATPPALTQEQVEQRPNRDTMIPRNHDTTVSRNHDATIPQAEGAIFEAVRRAVKHIGKEAATHRFTIDEKNHLADIEYTYKRQGIRTSENEITRIAINYFVEDYKTHGEKSLLAQILKRVNS